MSYEKKGGGSAPTTNVDSAARATAAAADAAAAQAKADADAAKALADANKARLDALSVASGTNTIPIIRATQSLSAPAKAEIEAQNGAGYILQSGDRAKVVNNVRAVVWFTHDGTSWDAGVAEPSTPNAWTRSITRASNAKTAPTDAEVTTANFGRPLQDGDVLNVRLSDNSVISFTRVSGAWDAGFELVSATVSAGVDAAEIWTAARAYAADETSSIRIPATGTFIDAQGNTLTNGALYNIAYPTPQTSGAAFDVAEALKVHAVRAPIPTTTIHELTSGESRDGINNTFGLVSGELLRGVTDTHVRGLNMGEGATYATLPDSNEGRVKALAGDRAFLLVDDVGKGTPEAPQYPRGWYESDGTSYALKIPVPLPKTIAPVTTVRDAATATDADIPSEKAVRAAINAVPANGKPVGDYTPSAALPSGTGVTAGDYLYVVSDGAMDQPFTGIQLRNGDEIAAKVDSPSKAADWHIRYKKTEIAQGTAAQIIAGTDKVQRTYPPEDVASAMRDTIRVRSVNNWDSTFAGYGNAAPATDNYTFRNGFRYDAIVASVPVGADPLTNTTSWRKSEPTAPDTTGVIQWNPEFNLSTNLNAMHFTGVKRMDFVKASSNNAIQLPIGTIQTANELLTELGLGGLTPARRVVRRRSGTTDAFVDGTATIGTGIYLLRISGINVLLDVVESSDGVANSPTAYTGTPAAPRFPAQSSLAVNTATNQVDRWWNPATSQWVNVASPPAAALAWAANTPVIANEQRTITINGVVGFGRNRGGARSTGATFDEAEAAQWDIFGQNGTVGISTNTVYPRGWRVWSGSTGYTALDTVRTPGTITATHLFDFWEISNLTQIPQRVWYHTGALPASPANIAPEAIAINTTTNRISHRWTGTAWQPLNTPLCQVLTGTTTANTTAGATTTTSVSYTIPAGMQIHDYEVTVCDTADPATGSWLKENFNPSAESAWRFRSARRQSTIDIYTTPDANVVSNLNNRPYRIALTFIPV